MEEPLVLENYGVKLKLLTHDKIEQLRQWRNDPKIQQYMFYREEITPEMQERWYANLDKKANLYFFIEYDGKEIGVINIKDIDFVKGCGESGVFIYDDTCLDSDVAYKAHLVMFDYVFDILQMNTLHAQLLPDNSRAIRFVKFLGYKVDEAKTTQDSIFVFLTKEAYRDNSNRVHFLKRWNHFNQK